MEDSVRYSKMEANCALVELKDKDSKCQVSRMDRRSRQRWSRCRMKSSSSSSISRLSSIITLFLALMLSSSFKCVRGNEANENNQVILRSNYNDLDLIRVQGNPKHNYTMMNDVDDIETRQKLIDLVEESDNFMSWLADQQEQNGEDGSRLALQPDTMSKSRTTEKQSKNGRSLISMRRKRSQDSDRLVNVKRNVSQNSESSEEETGLLFDKNIHNKLKCRLERNLYLDFDHFRHYTCANCYNIIPDKRFKNKLLYQKENYQIWLYDTKLKRTLLPNETEFIKSTFKSNDTYMNWRACCLTAVECCAKNSIYLPKTINANSGLLDAEQSDNCPSTWDGISCWPQSPAGKIATQYCPDHAYFLEFKPICNGVVTKQCFSNGSWFIRNGHEWSNYSNCANLSLYATRLIYGSIWHFISAIVIGPSLVVLEKMPNRGGSKRVKILSNLLFWLLINSLLSGAHKLAVIGGLFQPKWATYDWGSSSMPTPSQPSSMTGSSSKPPHLSHYSGQPMATTVSLNRQQREISNLSSNSNLSAAIDSWNQRMNSAQAYYEQLAQAIDDNSDRDCDDYNINKDNGKQSQKMLFAGNRDGTKLEEQGNEGMMVGLDQGRYTATASKVLLPGNTLKEGVTMSNIHDKYKTDQLTSGKSNLDISEDGISRVSSISSKHSDLNSIVDERAHPKPTTQTSLTRSRCQRNSSNQTKSLKQQQPLVVFACWISTVGIRITRLLHYAWMFTGAVYLCSILHFAPADPPATFIRWLMILTNGFPMLIGLVYIIVRTIYEPSPLTLLVNLPIYYLLGDKQHVQYLWNTQLDCWLSESKYTNIEEIAEFPNLVLVMLNGGLFIITLIIMCRITRPGSTRPEMGLGDYFRAAGTLVVLYGAHYALLVYRPPIEGCITGQTMYYLFLFVDGLQGILVSYVFCYRTLDGKEVVSKWLASLEEAKFGCFRLLCRSKTRTKDHKLLSASSRSNQSTRSNNSNCNGKEMASEFININDIPTASKI